MSDDDNLSELSEAARRAGYIVTEQIDAIIEKAEQQADAIRREAERDAEDTRRAAVESAQRLLARVEALEFPLGSLVASLRDEAEDVSRQLESRSHTVDTQGTALPSGPEEAHTAADEAGERVRSETATEPRDDEPDADEHFEEAHGEAFDGPPPEPAEQPKHGSGDWKRWIIEDEEDPPAHGEEPGSAAESPQAASEDDSAEAPTRRRGRRRAKPRS